VIGEVYEVDDKMLSNLDILEEHPKFYVREVRPVLRSDTNTVEECWIYFLKSFRPELLSKPFYAEYSSEGDHGLSYIEWYLREPGQPAKFEVQLNSN